MAPKLKPEEIVTLKVLKQKGQSNVQIAQALGVSEGTVRYHVRRAGKPDARRNKPRTADAFAAAIDHWLDSCQADPSRRDEAPQDGKIDLTWPRPANIHALHDWLCSEHGYTQYRTERHMWKRE
jgi:hypothetical protein